MTNTYDAKQVAVIVGTSRIEGFGEDTVVTAERDEQSYTKQVGADGQVTRSKSNNKAGVITITLQQGSPSNDILSALNNLDEVSNNGVRAVTIKDNSGRTLVFAREAWVQKPANAEFSRDAGEREWVLDTGPMDIFVGGNNAAASE